MTSFTSLALVDIQSVLDVDVIIFMVTLLSAFLLKSFTGHLGSEKHAKLPRGDTRHTERALARKSLPSSGAKRGGEGRCGAGPHARLADPSRIIDMVLNGIHDQHSMKFASKALTLYEEFKVSLAIQGVSVLGAARGAEHVAVEFYTVLVHCAIRTGQFWLVGPIMDDMVAQRVRRPLAFYESAMKQLAGQKQYNLALVVHDRLAADGLSPSTVTCSCLIGFAAEVGQFDRAVRFFDHLCTIETPSIRACMMVLRIHSKLQDWPASVATLREMRRRGAALDCLALNVVLATGVAMDYVEEAGELITEVDSYAKPVSDVVSYNTLSKGYAQRSNLDGVMETIHRMRQRKLSPNAITYNTAMDAAVRSGRTDEAKALLQQLREARLRPDKFTCSIFVKGLAKNPTAHHVQDALDLMNEVGAGCDTNLRSTLYHSILEAAVGVSDSEEDLVTRAFAQMRRQSVAPSPAAHRLLVQRLSTCDP